MGPTANGPIVVTSNNGRGRRELALGVLEREKGDSRERLACIPGSVPCLGEGTNRDDGVGEVGPAEWMYSLGIRLSLDQDVDVWRVQRAT